jgi:hypothetical protein
MKKRRAGNRGQVLIIFVFSIIGLLGITGLAIDGGNIFSDRRHAQNAADTASLAAALNRNSWEKNNGDCSGTINTLTNTIPACASGAVNDALNIAGTNGYTGNGSDISVDVYSPPMDGTYNDCSHPNLFDCHDYIEVVIQDSVNTWFARVLGIGQLHNKVEAVALANYTPTHSVYDGMSLIELGTNAGCGGDFILGGSSTLTLDGGGIYVNSSNSTCALKETNNCATVNLVNGAEIQRVGGFFTSGCSNTPATTQTSYQYPYPPQSDFVPLLTQPPNCGASHPAPTTSGGATTYYPGNYNSALPTGSNVVLSAGVYCVTGAQTQNSDYIDGTAGVFIYIKPGGRFNFNGGTVKLRATQTAPYQGFLIYVDSTYTGTQPNCIINGQAGDEFTGLIYAPWCDVSINGGSSPLGLKAQVVGFTLSISGSATLNWTFDSSLMPHIPEVNDTGLFH